MGALNCKQQAVNPQMYYGLMSSKRVVQGSMLRAITGDARSLDYSSKVDADLLGAPKPEA